MISSMTAFGRSERHYSWGSASWEIRSVNHRYLEPAFKLPEGLRHLEFPLREQLKQHLNRGKVDSSLKIILHHNEHSTLTVNTGKLGALLDATQTLRRQTGEWSALDPLQVLAWPGITTESEPYDPNILTNITEQFKLTVSELTDARRREGADLQHCLDQRLNEISKLLQQASGALPSILQAQKDQLIQKLQHVIAQIDQQRLEQELVHIAQKADVEEELDRLNTHVKEIRRVLEAGGTCGRRLDFLMQELHREANTLSAKSISTTTTLIAVELKVLIEQMREQVQNIE